MMQNVSKLNHVYAKLQLFLCQMHELYKALSVFHFKRTIFYTVNLILSAVKLLDNFNMGLL